MLINNGHNVMSLVKLTGASALTAWRSMHGRGGYLFKAGAGMSRYYGVPSGYNPGVAYIPPEKTGGMTGRLTVSPTSDVDIMGLGLATGDAAVILAFYANLAGVKWAESDLVCSPEFWANLMGYGSLSSDLSIGSRPSAEDIIYALMDTPAGYIGGLSLRVALDGVRSKTNVIPTDPASESGILAKESTSTTINGLLNTVQSLIAIIKSKTDLLPDDVTSKSDLETTHGLGKWESGIEFIEET